MTEQMKRFRKAKNEDEEMTESVVQLKTDDIRPNRAQPRADFNQNSIIRLADSIRRYGILQPLTVRRADDDDSYRYELIAGERRLRAARMLGYLTVPCVIRETDEKTAAELAIIENLQREDLNMFEEAYGYRKLIDNHGMTQDEVARRMSSSQSSVANKLRLLRMTYEEQLYIIENRLTERHARAMLRISDPKKRFDLIKRVCEEKLNVSETETLVEQAVAVGCKTEEKADKTVKSAAKIPSETVDAIRKKVDSWVKLGGNAEITITNRSDGVEMQIKLFNL